MTSQKDKTQLKKGHAAARLWTVARAFFGAGAKQKPKAGLVAAIEAQNTVGGADSHTESKKLVGLIHPGGFVVMTPQRRNSDSQSYK